VPPWAPESASEPTSATPGATRIPLCHSIRKHAVNTPLLADNDQGPARLPRAIPDRIVTRWHRVCAPIGVNFYISDTSAHRRRHVSRPNQQHVPTEGDTPCAPPSGPEPPRPPPRPARRETTPCAPPSGPEPQIRCRHGSATDGERCAIARLATSATACLF